MRKTVLIMLGLLVVSLVASCTITGKAYGVSPYTCKDSDGGRNPAVQGTVKNTVGSFVDTCTAPRMLLENYCKGNTRKKETVPCLGGCEDGACKN